MPGPIDLLRLYWMVSGDITDAKKEITVDNTQTPQWKTLPFWMHILGQVPAVAALFLGSTNPIVAILSGVGLLGTAVMGAVHAHGNAMQMAATSLTAAAQALQAATPADPAPAAPSK